MIYTVISILGENRINKNRDCRIVRQPLKLLPVEVKEYIEKTKNAELKAERELAYTTLFASLKKFFDIEKTNIGRTADGKPYLVGSSIHFNISHSDGVVAVCLSDEGEVGVDIQSEIDPQRAKRLEDRFFADLDVKSENLSGEYYLCHIDNGEATFESFCPATTDTENFNSKWTAAESLMKLYGRGFGDISSLPEISKRAKNSVRVVELNEKYYLSISVKNNYDY